MTNEERTHRDVQIVVARLHHESVEEVAERFGVTPRTVQRVVQTWRAERERTGGPPASTLDAQIGAL